MDASGEIFRLGCRFSLLRLTIQPLRTRFPSYIHNSHPSLRSYTPSLIDLRAPPASMKPLLPPQSSASSTPNSTPPAPLQSTTTLPASRHPQPIPPALLPQSLPAPTAPAAPSRQLLPSPRHSKTTMPNTEPASATPSSAPPSSPHTLLQRKTRPPCP